MKKYKSDLAICEWINRQFKDVDSKWLWCDHEKNQMFLEDENSYILNKLFKFYFNAFKENETKSVR